MKSNPKNYRGGGFTKFVALLLCLSLVLLPCRSPAPLSEAEVIAATCVVTLICVTGVAILIRACKPKGSLYWYRVGEGPKIYVCLDCSPKEVVHTHNFCQGPFGTMAYCNEVAFAANTTWNGEDHCGPRADSPIRKKASLNKSTDGGKTWAAVKTTTANIDANEGYVVMFPGTVLATNAFNELTLGELEIVNNPTNYVMASDSAAWFVMSSVVLDDGTNAPTSVKAFDAKRMGKDGLLKP